MPAALRAWLVGFLVLGALVLVFDNPSPSPKAAPLPAPVSGSEGAGTAVTAPTAGAAAGDGTPADIDGLLNPAGFYFGIATPSAPSKDRTEEVAQAAGNRPTVQSYFLKWNQEFDQGAFDESYRLGALPMVSWEPWAGGDKAAEQPEYALAKIASGAHDAYIKRFAQAAKRAGKPLVLRFGHEMNEPWYVWSEQRNGNRQGDYVAAWKHVHDLFQRQGATNVIWFWCPDAQSSGKPPLSRYFPGDAYVDWIGMEAYSSDEEEAAGPVLEATYKELTALSDKPVFIGEAGAKPSNAKALWTIDFFDWISEHPRVVGFVWFQFTEAEGGRFDWRFTTSPGTQGAFRQGLDEQVLVPWPIR